MSAVKMAIPNIARLTDRQIASRLKANGIETVEGADRKQLIKIAADNGLWVYKGDVVKPEFKARYGNEQRCGDELSEVLHEATRDGFGTLDVGKLRDIAKANDVDMSRWGHLNNGQKMMNVSNVLRGMLSRGEKVIVGDVSWNG